MRILITIISLFFATICNAQVKQARIQGVASTQRAVGYTDGDSITTRNINLGSLGTMPVAACANSSLLSNYVGCKVVGIRFALSQSIGKSSVFIYKIENGTMTDTLVTQTVRRTYDGWNNVFFNNGKEYTIQGDESFLFGFIYNETQEMIDNGNGALCTYTSGTQNSNAFLSVGDFGSGYGWYDFSSKGNICIELIIDVSNKPKYDITLSNLLIGGYYKKPNEKINYFIQYDNTGTETIDSCKLAYQFDGDEPVLVNCTKSLTETSSDSKDAYIYIPNTYQPGQHTFRFYIAEINGTIPQEPDTIEQKFVVYKEAFSRQKHYIEQYNTQRSYYSALVNTKMNAIAKANDKICLANMYESGSSLMKPESQNLCELYAYTYPCFTIDRFYFFGEKYTAFDVNDYISVYPAIVEESLQMLINEADENPAFATANINGSYDKDSRNLNITVHGSIAPDAKNIFGELALTLLLTEDSIKAPQVTLNTLTQTASTNKNYIHYNVFREYLTAPLGDLIATSDSTYSQSFNITIPTNYKAEKLNIIAFITRKSDNVTESILQEMDITNANSCRLADLALQEPDGISDITLSSSHSSTLSNQAYTITGQHADKNYHGIIIRNGRKFVK